MPVILTIILLSKSSSTLHKGSPSSIVTASKDTYFTSTSSTNTNSFSPVNLSI